LSFYNGLENVILSQYRTFSPEFRNEPATGKVFSTKSEVFKKLRELEGISSYTEVLEDKILAEYNQQQFIGRLKGVEPNSLHHVTNKQMLLEGNLEVQIDSTPYAILGTTVQANL